MVIRDFWACSSESRRLMKKWFSFDSVVGLCGVFRNGVPHVSEKGFNPWSAGGSFMVQKMAITSHSVGLSFKG